VLLALLPGASGCTEAEKGVETGGDAGDSAVQGDSTAKGADSMDGESLAEGGARLSLSVTKMDFGVVPAGTESTQSLEICNTGDMVLNLTGFELTGSVGFQIAGSKQSEWAVDVGGTLLVPPADIRTVGPRECVPVQISYAPLSQCTASAALVIHSDDGTKPDGAIVTLLANQATPCMVVEPASVLFFAEKDGETKHMVVEISLPGCEGADAALELIGLDVVEGEQWFSVDFAKSGLVEPTLETPWVIPSGSSVKVYVAFDYDEQSSFDALGVPIPMVGRLRIENKAGELSVEVPISANHPDNPCPTPIITCAEGEQAIPQTVLHLDGSLSYSIGAVIEKYEWSVVQPPHSNSVFVPSDNYVSPTFVANVGGQYEFLLTVWDSDGVKSCMPARTEVVVTPEEAIYVELLWNTPADSDETDTGEGAGSDLDLHFAHPLASQPDVDRDGFPDPWFDPLYDCFVLNPAPAWGSPNPIIDDDPTLLRADADGAGPEIVALAIPENHVYRVGVHYRDDYGFGAAYATLRVYIYGVTVFELAEVLMVSGDMWDAATIEWPSGKVTQIVGADSPYKITPQYANPEF